jgi:hypothetical protein
LRGEATTTLERVLIDGLVKPATRGRNDIAVDSFIVCLLVCVCVCVWLCISALENEEGGGSLCLLLQLNLSCLTR